MTLRPRAQSRVVPRGPRLAALCLLAVAAVLACLLGTHAASSPIGAGAAAPAQTMTVPASVMPAHADTHAGDDGRAPASATCAACSDEHPTTTTQTAALWVAILLGMAAIASVDRSLPRQPLALRPDTASRIVLSGSERRELLCIRRT